MKYLIILILCLFLSSCDLGCHKCAGGSDRFYKSLSLQLELHSISYETYLKESAKAQNCNTAVCDGNDRCTVHR